MKLSPLILGLLLAACIDGSVGGGRHLDLDGPSVGPKPDGGVIEVDGSVVIPDAGTPDAGEVDGGLVFTPFQSAAVGSLCAGTEAQRWLVLSESDQGCADRASWIENGVAPQPAAWFRLPDQIAAPTTLDVTGMVCLAAGTCTERSAMLTIDSYTDGQGAAGTWSIQFEDRRAEGQLAAAWCDLGGATEGAPAVGITIDEIAIYQSVKIELMTNGQEVTNHNAPVVRDRPAIVRLFVTLDGAWQPHEVAARLTLEPPGQAPMVLEQRMTPAGPSSDADPQSTFNFDVPAEAMVQGLTYRAGIYELQAECGGEQASGAVFPVSGSAAMNTRNSYGPLEVVLVPIAYNADGSGRLPDTSPAQLDRYRNRIYSMFPVPEVNLTVRQAVGWDNVLERNGNGWSQLLQAVLNLRNDDDPSANTYYYGIFAPADSFGAFCNGGCVAGLGPVPGAADDYSRGAIGLGFSGDGTADTAAHELGHALGRQHAPCQTNNADPSFPYNGGSIGTWGLDLVNRTLLSPNNVADLMGYCDPTWISDYNYDAIFNRLAFVNQAPAIVGSSAVSTWLTAIAGPEGLGWGDPIELKTPPIGDPVTVYFIDLLGQVADQQTAVAYELDHVPERLLLIPEPPPSIAYVEIPGVGRLRR